MPAGIMGFACKMYVEIAATPTEVKIVGDVTVNRKGTQPVVTTREDGGFQTWAKGLKELGGTFFLQKRKGNTGYNAIRDSWRNDTDIVVEFCDGNRATSGTDIVKFTATVVDFGEEQKLGDAVGHQVTVVPTWNTTPPAETTAAP